MASLTLFKQYLKEKPRQKEILCLYHYLCFFCQENSPLTKPLLKEFCQKALLFPHWQSHSAFLRQTLLEELTHFSKLYGPLSFDPLSLPPIDQWQCLKIWTKKDRINILQTHLQNQKKPADKIKVLPLERERTLALILEPTGVLKTLSFGPLFFIEQGQIKPLTPLTKLIYNTQYELSPNIPQRLEIKDGHFIHFNSKEGKVTGQGSQGFCFHQAEEFQQRDIKTLTFLYLPLKRLESLFIEPTSDPDYQELIHSLRISYYKLLTKPYEAHLNAELVLFQAKKALKNLYPQNALLLLLTANIEYHLRKIRQAPSLETSPPAEF